MKILLTTFLLLISSLYKPDSELALPENRKAVIVLTYDDALTSQLDIAIPQLNQPGLKGTFFMNEPAVDKDLDRWATVARSGHELANHTIYHPCLSSKIPRDARYHAENYTPYTILREIATMNKMLYALDKKRSHTYAYPCCETSVGGKDYVDTLKQSGLVKYARSCGGDPLITDYAKLDPFRVPAMMFNSEVTGKEMIDFVKKVQENKGMAVILFHGVGGDYLQVSSEAHQELVNYLKDHTKEVWVATFDQAMDYATKSARKK